MKINATGLGSFLGQFSSGWSPRTKLVWVDSTVVAVIGVLVWTMWIVPLPWAGVMMTVASVAVKAIGSPDQIVKLWKATKLNGHSIRYWLATLLSYVYWVTWGIRSHDYYTVAAQTLGVFGAVVICHLLIKLRLNHREMTDFDHPLGAEDCDVCALEFSTGEEAEECGMWISGWPKPCYSCPGLMHITARIAAEAQVDTICDICGRYRLFNVGETSRPEYWAGAVFAVVEGGGVGAELDWSRQQRVTQEAFMALLHDAIRLRETTGSFYDRTSGSAMAWGVPHAVLMFSADLQYGFVATPENEPPFGR